MNSTVNVCTVPTLSLHHRSLAHYLVYYTCKHKDRTHIVEKGEEGAKEEEEEEEVAENV